MIGLYNKSRLHIRDYNKLVHKGKVTCLLGHPLIAKKGTKKIHHYAHTANVDCIHKNKGEWHLWWQSRYLPECIELVIEDHRCDVRNRDGVVLELQHSYISQEDITSREKCYKEMYWILDGSVLQYTILGTYGDLVLCTVSHNSVLHNTTKRTWIDTGTVLWERIAYRKNILLARIWSVDQFDVLYGRDIVIPSNRGIQKIVPYIIEDALVVDLDTLHRNITLEDWVYNNYTFVAYLKLQYMAEWIKLAKEYWNVTGELIPVLEAGTITSSGVLAYEVPFYAHSLLIRPPIVKIEARKIRIKEKTQLSSLFSKDG